MSAMSSDEETSKPAETIETPAVQSQPVENANTQTETKTAQPELGEHWIKDGHDIYIWNPKPVEGETVIWSGGYVQDGDYRYANGTGTVTWYLKGEIEQVDEGTFEHGQRHGQFTHKFPNGKVVHSKWDHGIEITEPDSSVDDVSEAKQAFVNYHKDITNKNYRKAYETLSAAQRERIGDYNSYVEGFADTISSEVSDINLISSDENAYTFDYTLTARDRYQGNKTKIQTFKGQVTMAKDEGRWYVRSAKSSKINEKIE